MKQVTWKLALLLLTAVVTLQGCKKGENDPFLSLRSRDARITGEWELMKMETSIRIKYTSESSSASEIIETTSFNGTHLTFTGKVYHMSGPVDTTYTNSYNYVLVIEKDGNLTTTTIEKGNTSEYSGNWWWLNGKKKKTRIAFKDDANSFEIDQLKNNELILKKELTSYETNTYETSYKNDKKERSSITVMTFKKK
jgi:hypothetical protein